MVDRPGQFEGKAGAPFRGLEAMTFQDFDQLLAVGGRFVFYEYCISFVLLTLRRASKVHLLAHGKRGLLRGLPYSILSLLFGWWGLPWGFIYTPLTLVTNVKGGCDITQEVKAWLDTARAGCRS
jgi:hypothetical protein